MSSKKWINCIKPVVQLLLIWCLNKVDFLFCHNTEIEKWNEISFLHSSFYNKSKWSKELKGFIDDFSFIQNWFLAINGNKKTESIWCLQKIFLNQYFCSIFDMMNVYVLYRPMSFRYFIINSYLIQLFFCKLLRALENSKLNMNSFEK